MAAMLLWWAPSAFASSATSVNWAGYVAHRPGVHFRAVGAQWRVPAPNCSAAPGYSSMWIGLGGYSLRSSALEQSGTEVDCSPAGQPVFFAWYELVPAPAHRIPVTIHAGDLMRGQVSVWGRQVSIVLQDLTTHRSFSRVFSPSRLDATAADWIVEAPSECNRYGQCIGLPLADFGQVEFSAAHAATRGGAGGTVISGSWNHTAIALLPHSSRSFSASDVAAEAVPSALAAGGSTFTVDYHFSPQAAGLSAGNGGVRQLLNRARPRLRTRLAGLGVLEPVVR